MNWEEELFVVLDDLEQQAEAAYGLERHAELADRSRAEYGVVTLASRLMASLEAPVELDVAGAGRVSGKLRRVGADWLLLQGDSGSWVVRLAAVSTVRGASDRSVPEVAWSPITRLGLRSALRRLSEAGERCVVQLVDGGRRDGRVLRVGSDFAEVAVGAAERVELVAFGSLAAVQSRQ